MASISLCMIVRDEDKNIANCINSVKDIIDEAVIVDTGSIDKTKEVANELFKKLRLKARFFDFKWNDDFSAARNESLKHATKDWILVLDADEILDEESVKAIKELISGSDNRNNDSQDGKEYDKENDAFLFLQKNYTNDASIAGFVNEEHAQNGKKYAGWYGSFIARLFRNKKGYIFEGAVHELAEPSIESKGGKIAATGIVLYHYGNADPDIARKKRQLYLELCKKKIKAFEKSASLERERASVPRTRGADFSISQLASLYYELGVLYKENKNFHEALGSFKKSLELNPKQGMALYEMGVIYENCKDYYEAIKNYSESLKIRESSESFQNLGVCYLKKGLLKEAYRSLFRGMLLNPNKYTIYNNLGAVLEKAGNYDSAAQMLEIGIRLNPKNRLGFYNLGIALDKKGDFENAVKNYEKAVELGHAKSEEIKKRIKQVKAIITGEHKYKYGFNVRG